MMFMTNHEFHENLDFPSTSVHGGMISPEMISAKIHPPNQNITKDDHTFGDLGNPVNVKINNGAVFFNGAR